MMTQQTELEQYLAECEQLTPAQLLLRGYAPLAFVISHLLQFVAPLAMILGFTLDDFALESWCNGEEQGEQETAMQRERQ